MVRSDLNRTSVRRVVQSQYSDSLDSSRGAFRQHVIGLVRYISVYNRRFIFGLAGAKRQQSNKKAGEHGQI